MSPSPRTSTGQATRPAAEGSRLGYRSPRINYSLASNFQIWEVVRAATAAKFYFEPFKFFLHLHKARKDPEYILFEDGGFSVTNNPTNIGLQEIRSLHGANSIGVVVSVGTARAEKAGSDLLSTIKDAFYNETDADLVHENMETFSQNYHFDYFRLNGRDDYALDIGFDDWLPRGQFVKESEVGQQTLQKMRANFNEWYGDVDNQRLLRACAKELVGRRRARTVERARWERFALGSHFYCPESNCEADFSRRDRFREHLESHQNFDESDLTDERLNEYMFKWRYREGRRARQA
jgi:hypothetical protein